MNTQITELPDPTEVAADLEIMDFVAGRMTDPDREAFSERLREDAELAERVEQEIVLRDAIVSSARPEEMPGPETFETLRGRIDDEARGANRFWKPLAVAASLALAVLVAVQLDSPQPVFETLSSDAVQAVTGDLRFRVVFSAGSDQSQRDDLAQAYGFEIVSGPGQGGAYIVETLQPVSADQLDRWLEDDRIDFAEPVSYE